MNARLARFLLLAVAASAAARTAGPAALPGAVSVRAVGKSAISVSLTFFSPQPLPASLDFAGRLFLDGETRGIPVSGPVSASGHVSTASLRLPFDEITAAVFRRLRPDTFAYSLRGEAGEFRIAVSGSGRWSDVRVEDAARAAMRRWIALGRVSVRKVSLRRSVATARIEITNPLSVDVRLSRIDCRLDSGGRELGRGAGRDIVLRRNAVSRVDLRVDLDHPELVRAAGSAILSGGELDGRISGRIVLKMSGGTADLPFSVPGRISIL